MSIIPLDKLNKLRREQKNEQERLPLHAPNVEPLDMHSGSAEQEKEKRGIEIIDFTI
tara:strand:- start:295 stop:465 length:171 start_codon:yes stop_codon:yes gene_type:complete